MFSHATFSIRCTIFDRNYPRYSFALFERRSRIVARPCFVLLLLRMMQPLEMAASFFSFVAVIGLESSIEVSFLGKIQANDVPTSGRPRCLPNTSPRIANRTLLPLQKTPSRESFPFVRFNRREEKCGLELSDLSIREYFARENRIGQVFNEIK